MEICKVNQLLQQGLWPSGAGRHATGQSKSTYAPNRGRARGQISSGPLGLRGVNPMLQGLGDLIK